MADRRLIRAIPLDLAVAMLLGTSLFVTRVIVELFASREMFFGIRWNLFEYGSGVAQWVLVIAGLAALWRRATGQLAAMLGVATVARMIGAVWTVGWPVINRLIFDLDHEAIAHTFDIIGIGFFILDLGALVALLVAARAWQSRIGVIALVLLGIDLVPQVPWLGTQIWVHLIDNAPGRAAYQLTSSALSLAWLIVYALIAEQLPAAPSPERAARACRRAAWSLYARIWLAVGLALLAIGAMSTPSFATTLLYVTAIGSALAMGGFASGLVGLGQAGLPGMPVIRLYLAAFATLWWIAIQLDQAYVMFQGLSGSWLDSSEANDVAAWSVLGPLVMTAAIGFGASALQGLSNNGIADLTTSRIAWYVTLGAAGALIPLVASPETASGFVLMAFMAIGCGIGSLVALARLFSDAADRVKLWSAADVF